MGGMGCPCLLDSLSSVARARHARIHSICSSTDSSAHLEQSDCGGGGGAARWMLHPNDEEEDGGKERRARARALISVIEECDVEEEDEEEERRVTNCFAQRDRGAVH